MDIQGFLDKLNSGEPVTGGRRGAPVHARGEPGGFGAYRPAERQLPPPGGGAEDLCPAYRQTGGRQLHPLSPLLHRLRQEHPCGQRGVSQHGVQVSGPGRHFHRGRDLHRPQCGAGYPEPRHGPFPAQHHASRPHPHRQAGVDGSQRRHGHPSESLRHRHHVRHDPGEHQGLL